MLRTNTIDDVVLALDEAPVDPRTGNKVLYSVNWLATQDSMIGQVNEDWVRRELDWFNSGSNRLADMEGPVDVQGGPGGPRVLGHQLQVGEGGDQGEQERDQERRPDGAAHVGRDLAGEGVDAGPEDVAEDEEGQHRPGDDPVEAGLLGVLDAGDVPWGTWGRTVLRLAVDAVGHADHLSFGEVPHQGMPVEPSQ